MSDRPYFVELGSVAMVSYDVVICMLLEVKLGGGAV
jgi:hypothetical protein